MLGAECRPRALCVAQHCGERDHLNDDLHIVTLPQELIQSPPIDLWPKVSRRITMPLDVENILLTRLNGISRPTMSGIWGGPDMA
jgi:hypothetical protein